MRRSLFALHLYPATILTFSQPVKALHHQHSMDLAFWQLNHTTEVGSHTVEIQRHTNCFENVID
jgi:hypothetical protein